MKTPKSDKKKALKKYIEKTFVEMIGWYPEKFHYAFKYEDEETNYTNGIMGLEIDFNNMKIVLKVYKTTFDKTKSSIFITLSHEVGHIFVQHLNLLSSNRYTSEEEYSVALEQSATRVGWLIEHLVKGYKEPNNPKKKKIDK